MQITLFVSWHKNHPHRHRPADRRQIANDCEQSSSILLEISQCLTIIDVKMARPQNTACRSQNWKGVIVKIKTRLVLALWCVLGPRSSTTATATQILTNCKRTNAYSKGKNITTNPLPLPLHKFRKTRSPQTENAPQRCEVWFLHYNIVRDFYCRA